MSKYNDFGDFMVAVVDEAERKCWLHYKHGLMGIFHFGSSASSVIPIVSCILSVGWTAFLAVCALLVLGAFAFISALIPFAASGVGTLVIAALLAFGGIKALRLLYTYRIAPLAIKVVGIRYKPLFDAHINEYSYIDDLIDRASDELINR